MPQAHLTLLSHSPHWAILPLFTPSTWSVVSRSLFLNHLRWQSYLSCRRFVPSTHQLPVSATMSLPSWTIFHSFSLALVSSRANSRKFVCATMLSLPLCQSQECHSLFAMPSRPNCKEWPTRTSSASRRTYRLVRWHGRFSQTRPACVALRQLHQPEHERPTTTPPAAIDRAPSRRCSWC